MRTLHGWLAFLFAIPLVLASLSGAMLGFARESDRMFNVDLLSAPMSSAPSLLADALIDAARQAFPDHQIIGLAPATTPFDAALLLMVDGTGLRHEVFIHPRTGEIRGQRVVEDGFFAFAYTLHTSLLLDDTGRWLVRLAAFGLLVTTLSGLLLRSRTKTRSEAARIHPLLGLTTAPILLVMAASGLFFLAWQPGYGSTPRMAVTASTDAITLHSVQEALDALQKSHPTYAPRWITALDDEQLSLVCDTPNHAGTLGTRRLTWQRDFGFLTSDADATPTKGEVLYNLHTGELLGMPGRLLWVMAGLSVPILILGGIASRKARLKHAHHE